MSHPTFSIVVATYNRAVNLPRLVAALDAQRTDAPYEVLIVDNGSLDATTEVVHTLAKSTTRSLVGLRIDRNAGPAPARNLGWRTARGRYVAFTDDDCVPTEGWLAALIPHLERVSFVQGRTLPNPDQAHLSGPFSRTVRVEEENGFYETCNIAYRREVLKRIGGLDESFRMAGEDTDLAWRALAQGATSTFAADAVVHHDVVPMGYIGYLKNIKRWAGVVQVVKRHRGLRDRFGRTVLWRPNHRVAALTLLGVLLAGFALASGRAALIPALLLALPHVWFRLRRRPVPGGARRRLATLPLIVVADLLETMFHLVVLARVSLLRSEDVGSRRLGPQPPSSAPATRRRKDR